ncbi:MAG TPA: exodeoxyribonuclease III [Bacteroidia bacterium]|nr:exodeoxyribonuclease III [Bacteroidia bacterium]HNS12444.1 exodeoxyribonuclease III [Bacteroidia bacterium]
MKRIISYNVHGIRAALSKGFDQWMDETKADIICLQEIKASPEQLDLTIFEEKGYHHYWYPAEKKGYSGVAILSRQKPDKVIYGSGIKESDREGRVIRADYGDVSVLSIYAPSGSSGDERQDFKMLWLASFQKYLIKLKKERTKLILAGDFNICHRPIDIHNPISNAKSSGFLPEEREWMDQFLEKGFIDSFRHFNKEPHQYTWWSFRANARNKNLGWRIDYQFASNELEAQLKRSVLLPEARHSDHCPVLLEVKF